MTDARALVPKDKCDGSHIEELKRLSDGEIEPILSRLLAWIQDINWPVAADLLPVLAQRQTALLPLIREILRVEETDDVWKYWILTSLAPLFFRGERSKPSPGAGTNRDRAHTRRNRGRGNGRGGFPSAEAERKGLATAAKPGGMGFNRKEGFT